MQVHLLQKGTTNTQGCPPLTLPVQSKGGQHPPCPRLHLQELLLTAATVSPQPLGARVIHVQDRGVFPRWATVPCLKDRGNGVSEQ